MTTNVTVKTFDNKAEVHRINPETGEDSHIAPEIVDEGSQVVFYVHSGQNILVKEMPND
jgi:hypothetical protein